MDSLCLWKRRGPDKQKKMLQFRRLFDTQAVNYVGGIQAGELQTAESQRRMDHMLDAVIVLDVNWAALPSSAS